MCGIAGLLSPTRSNLALVRPMAAVLAHRGPNDEGCWIDPEAGIGLGHRRLAIVDLSTAGHQPVLSRDGRYVLVWNGEIYNHRELRARLIPPEGGWAGHCDSETLIEAIAAWGLEQALGDSVGMFALALWDRAERCLHLARDRFGEKPLYHGWIGGDFVFASELKAIRVHPGFAGTIDRDALRIFAARGYVPAPLSIFSGIAKLAPGTILSLGPERPVPRSQPYWSYRTVVEDGLRRPIADAGEAKAALRAALTDAVALQSQADVPVGVFLSGGVDSSLMTALWARRSGRALKSFTIGFAEAGFDETPYAKAVAEVLGSDHREHVLSAAEAQAVIPSLPQIYDEPFADPAQIPTLLLSRLARAEVKVALSGDGGDELFGGYPRHQTAARLWQGMRRVPPGLRHAAGGLLGRVPPGFWDGAVRLARGRAAQPGVRLGRTFHRFAGIDDFAALYGSFRDEYAGEPSPILGGSGERRAGALDLEVAGAPDIVRAMYCDATSYLPGDILCKVDRASMAHGLEVRIPFLDHRVAALAARIPLAMKVQDGVGKRILRQLLAEYLPPALIARPKAGFSVPLGAWLKGPLRPWAEATLSPDRLRADGYFDPKAIGARWQAHLAGRRDATYALWPVLMFQTWLEQSAAPVQSPLAAVG